MKIELVLRMNILCTFVFYQGCQIQGQEKKPFFQKKEESSSEEEEVVEENKKPIVEEKIIEERSQTSKPLKGLYTAPEKKAPIVQEKKDEVVEEKENKKVKFEYKKLTAPDILTPGFDLLCVPHSFFNLFQAMAEEKKLLPNVRGEDRKKRFDEFLSIVRKYMKEGIQNGFIKADDEEHKKHMLQGKWLTQQAMQYILIQKEISNFFHLEPSDFLEIFLINEDEKESHPIWKFLKDRNMYSRASVKNIEYAVSKNKKAYILYTKPAYAYSFLMEDTVDGYRFIGMDSHGTEPPFEGLISILQDSRFF